MSLPPVSTAGQSRRKALFLGLTTALAFASPLALATSTVWTVDICSESVSTDGLHSGSLRFALAQAASGDTIDMTQIGAPVCSVISLTTGALSITQDSLIVYGPGQNKLRIEAGVVDERVIDHTGTGTLYLSGLSIRDGTASDAVAGVYGGCIRSSGTVSISQSNIYGCQVTAGGASNVAAGGAVFALHGVVLDHAIVRYNTVTAPAGGFSQGGGIAVSAAGTFAASYSTIAYNQSLSSTSYHGLGGGLFLRGGATITNSTISGNTSGQMGGFRIAGSAASRTVLIANSTISGNTTAGDYSGGSILGANTTIANVTIAFNHSSRVNTNDPLTAGLVVNGSSSYSIDVQSTLAAANTFGAGPNDLFLFNGAVTGSNNLATAVYDNIAYPGTVSGVCAQLGPLRDNGGLTKTHALHSDSPAIDQGNNALAYSADQRALPYARASGLQADIGAYEVQQDDVIFDVGFDLCPFANTLP